MDRGRKRALSPSAVALAKKQKQKLHADDRRVIQDAATALIRARHRSQARREAIHKSNATDSPLLRLPGEIRNMIFGWVFRGVKYGLDTNWGPLDSGVRMQIETDSGSLALNGLNLLLVCRQIHVETALLPYSLGSFDIWGYFLTTEEDLETVERFLKERTQEQIEAITCMRIEAFDNKGGPNLVEGNGAFWVAELEEASSQAVLSDFTTSSINSSV